MMKYVLGISATFMILTSCKNNTTHTTDDNKSEKPKLTVSMLATPHDYVCGMDLERDEFVADTTMYDGKIYGFCAPECKAEFLKDPKQYLSQQ